MNYRKKPVVIQARQFISRDYDQQMALAEWCGGRLRAVALKPEDRRIEIDTLEGVITASFGDWIIKGVKGEFYPCKPEIFEATYEKAE